MQSTGNLQGCCSETNTNRGTQEGPPRKVTSSRTPCHPGFRFQTWTSQTAPTRYQYFAIVLHASAMPDYSTCTRFLSETWTQSSDGRMWKRGQWGPFRYQHVRLGDSWCVSSGWCGDSGWSQLGSREQLSSVFHLKVSTWSLFWTRNWGHQIKGFLPYLFTRSWRLQAWMLEASDSDWNPSSLKSVQALEAWDSRFGRTVPYALGVSMRLGLGQLPATFHGLRVSAPKFAGRGMKGPSVDLPTSVGEEKTRRIRHPEGGTCIISSQTFFFFKLRFPCLVAPKHYHLFFWVLAAEPSLQTWGLGWARDCWRQLTSTEFNHSLCQSFAAIRADT